MRSVADTIILFADHAARSSPASNPGWKREDRVM
jgi:hypothetical protein